MSKENVEHIFISALQGRVLELEALLRRIQKDGYDPLWRIADDVAEALGSQSAKTEEPSV
jgi:hypothetical protein